MKKALCIIIAVVVLLVCLFLWQKNNIEALYLFLTKDSEGVSNYIDETQKKLEEEIKGYTEHLPRTLTEEEENMLASGELSVEDAAKILMEEPDEPEPAEKEPEKVTEVPEKVTSETTVTESKEEVKPTKENSSEASTGNIIKRYTANFYSLKAYYIGQLNQVEASARSEYSALSATERKNLSKAAFIGKYVGYATSLQSECDSKVEGLLADMKKEILK